MSVIVLGSHAGRSTDRRSPRLLIPVSQSGLNVSHMWPVLAAAEHRSGADKASSGTFRKGIWTTM